MDLLVVGDHDHAAPISSSAASTASQNAGKSGPLRVVPPLAVRMKGRLSFHTPKPTARATVHCTDMAANTAPIIWPRRDRDAQPVERDEVRERDDEGRQDRDGENLVGDRDAGEGDDRHPDQVEDRHRDADQFRAQPVEPAERKFALLLARQLRAPGSSCRQCFLKIWKPP